METPVNVNKELRETEDHQQREKELN